MLNSVAAIVLIVCLAFGFGDSAPVACTPGEMYCGGQLHNMEYTGGDPNTLYECGPTCEANYLFKCQYGFGCRVRGDYAFCPLYNGSRYCGYELKLFGDRRYHLEQDLFNSHGGLVQGCPDGCESGNFQRDSQCASGASNACTVGQKYCGLELSYKKFQVWAPHTLFECTTGTISNTTMKRLEHCRSGCIIGSPSKCDEKPPVQTPSGITCPVTTWPTPTGSAPASPAPTQAPSGPSGSGSGPSGSVCTPTPGEIYRIVHRTSNSIVAVPSGGRAVDDLVKLAPNSADQAYARVKFALVPGSSNLYHIVFAHSNMNAAVYHAFGDRGTKVIQHNGGTANERFFIEPTADGWCTIRAAHSNRYLTAEANQPGSQVIQGDQTASNDAHFRFERVGGACTPTPGEIYRIVHRSSNSFVAVPSGGRAIDDLVKLAPYTPEQPFARVKFTLIPGSTNLYHIVFTLSNMNMAVYHALGDRGTKIIQHNGGSANERFFIEPTADGWCTIRASHSNRYLTAEENRPGSQVIQGDQTASVDAHFKFEPGGPGNLCLPPPNAQFLLLHRTSNLLVAVPSGGTAIDEPVKLVASNNREPYARMKFALVPGTTGLYIMSFVHSNKNAAVYHAKHEKGTKVIQHNGGSANERFYINITSEVAWCTIRASHSNRYLTAEGNQVGSQIIQGDQTPSNDAHFRLLPFGTVGPKTTG